MSKYRVDEFEAQELAGAILGIDEDDDRGVEYEEAIEQALFNKYDVTLEDYTTIVQDLMDKLTVACSPITDKVYIGFSEPGMWLVKKECDNWIQQVLQWLGGNDTAKSGEEWTKQITAGDKIEYEITLKKM